MNKSDEYEFVCELSNGHTVPVQGTDVQMKQLRSMLKRGSLVSAESTIEVSSDVAEDGIAHLPPGKVMAKKKKSSSNGGHNLASSEELKPLLAIAVTDSSGKVHPDSADIMSDKIFGTNGDVVNAKSQLAACSFGKFLITHDYTEDISQHLSAPGVIDVKIDTTLLGNDRHTIVNSAISAVEDKLGLGLSFKCYLSKSTKNGLDNFTKTSASMQYSFSSAATWRLPPLDRRSPFVFNCLPRTTIISPLFDSVMTGMFDRYVVLDKAFNAASALCRRSQVRVGGTHGA